MIESGSGRPDEAISAFQKSLDLDPSNAATYGEMALAYEAAGRLTDAEESDLKATTLRPGDWSTRSALALFYYRHGRYAEAIPLFRRGLELAPDNISLYTNLGATYWMNGQLDEAAASWERSLALRPSPSAYSNLGTVYFYQGRCQDAAPMMEHAAEAQPRNNDFAANLADVYACLGQTEKAKAAYERAVSLVEERLKVNPGDPESVSARGLYRARLGDRLRALSDTGRAEKLGPANRTVFWHAALVYELCGRRDDALDALANALRLGEPLNEVRNEPALARLRTDPRYQSLISAKTK